MKILHYKGLQIFIFLSEKINKCAFLSVMIVLSIACFPNLVVAEQELSFKQMLLTPGDLVEGHAEIENKCESCHVHFEKANQTPLCLDCHEAINDDLATKKSFHGLLPKENIKDCKNCHTDHKGRDFDITGLDKDNFDHSMTNFILQGSHSNLECSSCHTALKKTPNQAVGLKKLPVGEGFRFKQFECASCHVDFHEEALGNECDSCHSPKAWTSSDFEHDKTDFPLDGEHKNLQCNSCHIDDRLEKIDTQCQSCHLAKEPHLGVFGTECADCHLTNQWKPKTYNHFKETGYRLEDSHLELNGVALACISCHSEKLKPNTQCLGCHSADDVHQGANGDTCQNCHNQKSWNKTDFSHDFDTTGFILTGKHKKVDCESCHIPGERSNSPNKIADLGLVRDCIDCHQVIDPHFSKLGKDCGNCHQTENWHDSSRFNHDFSDFPLTGSHQLLVCDACHISSEFSEQSQKCVNCHKSDDFHDETLGDSCDSCHDTSVWSHWQFDHQRQTKFALEGAHQNLECGLCHSQQMRDPLKPSNQCIDCHRDDDAHNGGFGVECQECHSQINFEELSF